MTPHLRRFAVLVTAGVLTFTSLSAAALATPAATPTAGSAATATATATATSTSTLPAMEAVVHHRTAHDCAAPTPGRMTCHAIRQTDTVEPGQFKRAAVIPAVLPAGYSPSQLRSAYKLTATGSSAQIVAVVDAYNDPTAASDLAVYRAQYGLPPCTKSTGCFTQVNQNGATAPLPANNAGWAGEISLDLDMVSAICPGCRILLVEAATASSLNLYAAEDRAVAMGAKFISNSWGGGEYSGQTSDDVYFNHPGVAITVSAGDNGTGAEYPASSRYVTAVGGTTLTPSATARGWAETAWSDAGSGCSAYDVKPSFQSALNTNCARRAEADVSAVADPNTGVAVYQTYGNSGWAVYGGTSVSAPIVASVYALAGNPGASDYPNSFPYAHPGNLFDVSSGDNGSCGAPICAAGSGWDGPTGLGTPNGTAAFLGAAASATVSVTNPGTQTATVGVATSLTLSASGGSGTYVWAATGLPHGLSIGSSSATIAGSPTAAGTFTVTARATGGASSASVTFSIVVAAVRACTVTQTLVNPGFESGQAGWTSSAGVIGAYASSGEPTHSGSWDAWLDGYGTTHTDTLSQSVTIPPGCTKTTVTFYLHVDTAETTTSSPYDVLTVKAGTTTLATFSNLNRAAGYAVHSYSLAAFAGKTVTIAFVGTENSSLQTSFVLDDLAVTTG